MEVYDVVKKLLGGIEPIGSTDVDDVKLENLKETIELVDKLIFDIYSVSLSSDSYMCSVSKSGKKAKEFLEQLKEEYLDK